MIRGTTAQFKFKLPCEKQYIERAAIKFWQPNNHSDLLPIIKHETDCTNPGDSTELCISLTAEETARFLDTCRAKVQIRVKLSDGTVFGSKPQFVVVYPMDDEILKEDLENQI